MGHIKVARWTYYTGNFIDKIKYVLILAMGNFQKQTFIECDSCDRPDKRRVSYESRRPWFIRSFSDIVCLTYKVIFEKKIF
jgi:hypothetical protein